ncbi:MAG: hypothetical protein QM490_06100, partial [Candidatus Gracilibacteria bacterium]
MSNYSELCKSNSDLLGTGASKCPKSLGAVVKFFLSENTYTETAANLKLKSTWDAAILAGSIIPFPEVVAIEPQNVEAGYQELPNGSSIKNKEERRKTMYSFVESIVTHSGMKSYSDRGWNIWYATADNYLICHTKSADTYEGLKASRFYVNAQTTQTFDAVNQTNIVIEQNNVDDLDKEFAIIQPDFDLINLKGAIPTDLSIVSATQATGTLTINVKLTIQGENTPLIGVTSSNFLVVDESGVTVTVDSAVESPSGTYAIVCTDDATTGNISMKIN